MKPKIQTYLKQIRLPRPDSHKGQNGKLLIIGGSDLFHAASKWSLDVASRFVDMLFYASAPQNNELIKEAKGEFWNGIVVPRGEVENYIEEADCILIGPGMERNKETEEIVNNLLRKFPHKKWVVDAGALQMVDINLLNKNCIITPHKKEFARLQTEFKNLKNRGVVILLKGQVDLVINSQEEIEISGGNPGMTKGGTGDVLAGLVAALYCKHDAMTSCVAASVANKKTADQLYEKVGPYFNASDLAAQLPAVFYRIICDN